MSICFSNTWIVNSSLMFSSTSSSSLLLVFSHFFLQIMGQIFLLLIMFIAFWLILVLWMLHCWMSEFCYIPLKSVMLFFFFLVKQLSYLQICLIPLRPVFKLLLGSFSVAFTPEIVQSYYWCLYWLPPVSHTEHQGLNIFLRCANFVNQFTVSWSFFALPCKIVLTYMCMA